MAQVLNVQNRVVEHPNRYKLNPVAGEANTYDFEKVPGEISNPGTPYNRGLMNKIDAILSYNEITGIYDDTNNIIEYSINYDLSSYINNQKLNVMLTNNVLSPANDFNILVDKEFTTSNTAQEIKPIELNNGNIMILQENSDAGKFSIIDINGTIIKESVGIGNYFRNINGVKLSNGNVMAVGYRNNSSYTGYMAIISEDGTVIKLPTQLGSGFYSPSILLMSDNNVMIAGNRYIIIVDKDGNILYGPYDKSPYYFLNSIVELNNGNILIVGITEDSNNVRGIIVDKTGNTIVNSFLISTSSFQYPSILKIANDNILIAYYKSSKVNFAIIDSNGNILTKDNILSDSNGYLNTILLNNNNILILSSKNGYVYANIVNSTGTIIKSDVSIASINLYYAKAIALNQGNIFVYGYSSSIPYTLYGIIIDNECNVIKSISSIKNNFYAPNDIELDNLIFLVGYDPNNYRPNTVTIETFNSTGTAAINNIPIDTILEKDKYYELVYNESLDKFIAEEVRNAN